GDCLLTDTLEYLRKRKQIMVVEAEVPLRNVSAAERRAEQVRQAVDRLGSVYAAAQELGLLRPQVVDAYVTSLIQEQAKSPSTAQMTWDEALKKLPQTPVRYLVHADEVYR